MTSLINCPECPTFKVNPSNFGFSPESNTVNELLEERRSDVRKTESMGHPLDETLQLLYKVYEEYSEPNWDGYGAFPVTEGAYCEAEKLIKLLPLFIPMPEVFPESSGEICLEWYRNKRLVFVVSVSGQNTITYAGLFGKYKTNATEYFGESVPSNIVTNILRLYHQ